MRTMAIASLLIGSAWLSGCNAVSSMADPPDPPAATCNITALITPASASADHSLAAPGNQVQFTATSNVTGNCPLIADQLGSWSTSDPVNTAVLAATTSQTATAACKGATSTAATISYSGTVRGHSFTPATLTCK